MDMLPYSGAVGLLLYMDMVDLFTHMIHISFDMVGISIYMILSLRTF
jgi:hypothetical protein